MPLAESAAAGHGQHSVSLSKWIEMPSSCSEST